MPYKHTQIGYLIIYVSLPVLLLFGFILTQADFDPIILILMFLILFLLGSFASLTAIVDKNYLKIKFGYGIFRKRFELSEIEFVKTVRNHWYYGWGIRVWWWPRMLIFNVSGFDAVEIVMRNGKIYRIGTDEPQNLENAILQAINK